MSQNTCKQSKFYRPRNPEQSPFYKLVREHFDEFERIYTEKYEKTHGFWRPIIRKTIDKFLKCGDLKEGFARVKCTKCGKELFVSYSCKTRCCCPSCHQKRTLSLAYNIQKNVLAEIPHRQFVLTLPKRLRIYFRYDRTLLSDLLKGAWKTVRDIFIEEVGYDDVYPAMIGCVQTYGDIMNWNVHVHALVGCGVFLESGKFIPIDTIPLDRFLKKWEEVVFDFLLKKGKITTEIIENMNSWKNSGFSVDTSVYIDKDDTKGMNRLIQYIVRCPFSLARFVRYTDEGKVLYRATKSSCLPFPLRGDENLKAGTKRNFEIFEPYDFLAEMVQHIPNKGEQLIRYYGFYSSKKRGMKNKKDEKNVGDQKQKRKKKCSLTWAMLIKMVYEVEPLICPVCQSEMKIVSLIDGKKQPNVVEKILRHCELWKDPIPRPPPEIEISQIEDAEKSCYDFTFFDNVCA